MKPGDQYHRLVHWSEEDQSYIGYCPDLYFGGVCPRPERAGGLWRTLRHHPGRNPPPHRQTPSPPSACRPHHPRLAFRHRLRRGRESLCSAGLDATQPNGPVWKAQFRTCGAATKISPAVTPKARPQSPGGRWKASASQL